MLGHISINKHQFNVRRVEELGKKLLEKEKELENTEGFFAQFKLKSEIRRIRRRLMRHGEEVLEFEYRKINNETD